jgi:uncharacterized protein (DUF305 family)
MKNLAAYGIFLTLVIVAVGLACETQQTSSGSNNSNAVDHSAHDMSNMNSHDMSNMNHGASAPNAAEQPYDLQFIDSMTHHHDGAIQMAEMALRNTEREELKKFAQKIIDDQKKENAQMKAWRDQWYAGKPSAMNMELPGMKMGGTMSTDHAKMMESMRGKDFDIHFIDMMIPHHEGAVEMARELLRKGEHAELKTMANEIIREQEAEIRQMQAWKAEWSR